MPMLAQSLLSKLFDFISPRGNPAVNRATREPVFFREGPVQRKGNLENPAYVARGFVNPFIFGKSRGTYTVADQTNPLLHSVIQPHENVHVLQNKFNLPNEEIINEVLSPDELAQFKASLMKSVGGQYKSSQWNAEIPAYLTNEPRFRKALLNAVTRRNQEAGQMLQKSLFMAGLLGE